MGAYQRSNHILLGGTLAPRGCVSKVKPYPHWRGPDPETGRIKGQTICSLTGPWPERGCIKGQTISSLAGPGPEWGRIKTHAIYSLTGPWPREGGISKVKPYIPCRGLCPERGRINCQTIYFLAGPWPREGAHQRSSHILLDGALAPGGGVSKVKPYIP
jgi:hypothetical protein